MNLSDYEAIWKRQEVPLGMAADLADLKNTFEVKRRKFERTIVLRNSIEGVGGIIGSVGLILLPWWLFGITGWPFILGVMIILGVSSIFLRDMLRFRRVRLGPEASMLAKLENYIAELHHERHLFAHVGKWYVTPYFVAFSLYFYGFLRHAGPRIGSDELIALFTTPNTLAWIVILISTPTLAIFWWWRDVQSSIRLRIDPRIEELEKLRQSLVGKI